MKLTQVSAIAIVDDKAENRAAAVKAIARLLPTTKVIEFSSAGTVIKSLQEGWFPADLILTDLEMEDTEAGHRVLHEAWSWNIPTTVVTGREVANHGDDTLVTFPSIAIGGKKDNPAVWEQVVTGILDEEGGLNIIHEHLDEGRFKTSDPVYGIRMGNLFVFPDHLRPRQ